MGTGTRARETRARETRRRGTRRRGTRARGTRARGTRTRGTRGLGDAWRLVINKPDFCAEFVKYNFRWSRESCNMLESLSVVADNF